MGLSGGKHGVLAHLATRSIPSSIVVVILGLAMIWMTDRFVRGGDNLQLWDVAYRTLGFICLCLGAAGLFARYRRSRSD